MTMRRFFIFLLLIAVLSPSITSAEVAKTLGWRDLVPKLEPLKNPLEGLEPTLRYDIEYLATIRYWTDTGQIFEVDSEFERGVELEHQFKKDRVDFEPMVASFNNFLNEIDRRNRMVVQELDGELVRIPGFALPLETSATAVSEFLLVPSIGACIHTPVPPANQLVFVKLNQSYKMSKLYEPIWITGRMKIESVQRAVSYSDGKNGVESAYAMEAVSIEPYRRKN
jgi:hypothetical protein